MIRLLDHTLALVVLGTDTGLTISFFPGHVENKNEERRRYVR